VDLLWFGGIGTYVKGSAENNVSVGDPANDGLRVDGLICAQGDRRRC
jgi:glutamate dehydrogenase